MDHPLPNEIIAARKAAGLTQAQAAELVHLGANTRWAEYENGTQRIDLARWELFIIKSAKFVRRQRRRELAANSKQR